MKRFRFLLLAISINIPLLSNAQALDIYLGREKTSFSISKDNILVRFTDKSTESSRSAAIAKFHYLKPYLSSQNSKSIPAPSSTFHRLELKEPLDGGEVQKLAKNLALDTNVIRFAHPMVIHKDGTLQAYTDRFYVRLKENTSLKMLDSMCKSTGSTIINSDTYNSDIYFIAAGKKAQYDAFEMANIFSSSGLFEFSEPDFIRFLKKLTTDTYYGYQWALKNTGSAIQYNGKPGADLKIESAWQFTSGTPNVKVAIVDEGVDLVHPDLKANLLQGYDATLQNSGGAPSGDDAHGTNCAGIVAAVSNNNLGVSGVAPECKVIPVRIAYGIGFGWMTSDAWIADGLNWAWKVGQADILSNSWGGGSNSSLINTAISNAVSRGRNGLGSVVFFAAGNDNGSLIYPATQTQVIAVGASSMCDERKSFTSCDGEYFWGSCYGTGVDVFAAGVKIYSTDISGPRGYATGDYFSTFNGTSSATPAAAGVMALILSANPTLNSQSARFALESNCDKVGGYSYNSSVNGQPNGTWSNELGYGRINAFKAVNSIAFQPCTGLKTLNTPTGILGDGSGRSTYAPNSNCEWIINPVGARTISMSFLDFNTESNNDYVEVYDGTTSTGILLGRFSGPSLPSTLYAYSGAMYVHFVSNGTVNNQGWTATYSSCASILAPPIVSYFGNTTFCDGEDITLTAPTGYTDYQWLQNGIPIPNAISKSFIANESGYYSVSVKTISGCNAVSPNVLVTTKPLPVANITPLGNPATLCTNISLPLVSTSCAGCTYQWLLNNQTIAGANNPTLTAVGAGFYNVVISNGASNCWNSSSLLQVSIANIKATTSKNTVCNGDTTTLNVLLNSNSFGSASSNYAFSWSPSNSLNTITTISPIANPKTNTTYIVSVQEKSTGCSKSDAVSVSVANAPSSIITANGNTVFCKTGSVSLNVPGGTALSYQWLLNGTSIPGANSSVYIASSFGKYTAKVTNGHTGCFSSSTNPLEVTNSQPDVTIFSSANASTFCSVVNTILSIKTGTGYIYQWYKNRNPITTATSFQLAVNETADFSVTVIDNFNCSNTSPLLTVGFGSIKATESPSTICAGDSSILSVDFIGGSKSTILSDNFDPIQPSNWALNTGTTSVLCGATSGNALYFNDGSLRVAETIPLDLSKGGNVTFSLVIGSGYYPCENADQGEGINLEYSVDGGSSWIPINYYEPGSFNLPTLINETLPTLALSNQTKIRWSQPIYSGYGFDNWAIDNVAITSLLSSGSYIYNWSPTTGVSSKILVKPTTSKKYKVIVTDPTTGCYRQDSLLVQVIEPSLADIFVSGSANVCENDSVLLYTALTTSNGLSIQWNKDGLPLYGQNLPYLYAKLPGTYSISISNNATNCSVNSLHTITITSKPSPIAQIQYTGSTTSFCNSFNVGMSVNFIPAHIYQWSLNGLPITGATTSSFTGTKSGNYTVAIRNNTNGCLSISPPLVLTTATVSIFNSTNIVCSYYDSTRLSALVVGYPIPGTIVETFDPLNASNWSINNGIVSSVCGSYLGNALLFSGSARVLQTYPMNTSNGGTINFYLKIAYNYSTTNTCDPVEYGEDVTLEYSTDGGNYWNIINTYYYYNYNNFTNITEQIPLSARANNVIFRWRQANFSGSGMDVWALDNINIISGGNSSGFTYSWTPTAGLFRPQSAITSARPTSTTLYSVEVTQNTTGCKIYGFTTVTNLYNNVPQIQTNKTPTICTGDTVLLSVPYMKNFNYYWYKDGNSIYSYTNTVPNIFYATAQGSYQVQMSSSSSSTYCYLYSNNLTVNVNPGPNTAISTSGPVRSLCQTISVTLSAPYNSSYTYQWKKDGSNIVAANQYSYFVTSSGNYSVKIANPYFNNCFKESAPVTVSSGGVNVTASKTTFCNNDSIRLSAFIPGQTQAIFSDDFDPITYNQWYSLQGCNPDIACGAVSGNALYFNGSYYRYAQTIGLNVANGGIVSFYLKLAGNNSTVQCETVDLGEDIYLQYSIDYGSTWNTIQTFPSGNYANFTPINVTIPYGAQTNYTMFRWSQPTFSGYGSDNWSIDNVQIGTSASSGNNYTYTWTPSSTLKNSTTANPVAKPSSTTTYSVTVRETTSGCTGNGNITLTKTAGPSKILNIVGPTSLCPSDSVILSADINASNVTYQWYNNGNMLNGENGYSLNIKTAGIYSCNMVSDCGNITSNSVTVTQKPGTPKPYITPFGDSLYSSNPSGNQWYFNHSPIANATSAKIRHNQVGDYQVQVTNAYGCSAISGIYTNSSIILSQKYNIDPEEISVFPIPADDYIIVQIPHNEEVYQITIHNLIGSTIYAASLPQTQNIKIDTRNYPSGLYLITISDGQKHKTQKIEIQR